MKQLRTFKEEAIMVMVTSLVLLLLRWVGSYFWPKTGQYDLVAETETILFTVLRLIIYSLSAWLGLRVIMPKAYTYLKNEVYLKFDSFQDDQKLSVSTRMFAVLLGALVLLAMSGCTTTLHAQQQQVGGVRAAVVASAMQDVGVREATGSNDGVRVEQYLALVGQPKGRSWCAAFVCFHLSVNGIANPRNAWSPALVGGKAAVVWTGRKAVRAPLPADVFALYYPQLGRVGHVGFVTGVDGRYITTVEGNTSGPGSREGDGVYARRRELSKVYCIANYIPDETNDDGAVRSTGAPDRLSRKAAHGGDDNDGDDRAGNPADVTRYEHRGPWGQRVGDRHQAAVHGQVGHGVREQRSSDGDGVERGRPQDGRGGYCSIVCVRLGQHQGPALGHVHEGAQGEGDRAQRGDGEVPDAWLGLVDAGGSDTAGRVASLQHVPQVHPALTRTDHA